MSEQDTALDPNDDPGPYNQIYEKLVVDDDEDLVGLIAYSLYKQSKREWLVEFGARYGRRPTREEEGVFVSGYTKKDLPRLRDQAERMLSAYAETVIVSVRPDIEAEARNAEIIRMVGSALRSIERQGAWWRQIFAGAIGAFGYSVLLLLLFVVISLLGVDPVALIERTGPGGSP